MGYNNNSGLSTEEKNEVLGEIFSEMRTEEERKKQLEAVAEAEAYDKGWKEILEHLTKTKNPIVQTYLAEKGNDPVYTWFDNAASLIEKYNASKFKTARDTFISTLKTVDDEKMRMCVAEAMRFVFKKAAIKIAPLEYAKAVYAFRALSEQIGDVLGESPYAKVIIVNVWKDTVFIRHRGGPVKNILDIFKKTWFEKMINDIKAEDPTYEAPKFRLGLIAGDCGDH